MTATGRLALVVAVAALATSCGEAGMETSGSPTSVAAARVEGPGSEVNTSVEVKLEMGPNEVVRAVRFILSGDVLFDVDSAELSVAADHALAQVLSGFQSYRGASLRIEAHADSDGSDDHNDALSLRRGQAAAAYFVANGVDASRITTIGWGERRPAAPNDTPAGKRRNRRVEITVVLASG